MYFGSCSAEYIPSLPIQIARYLNFRAYTVGKSAPYNKNTN